MKKQKKPNQIAAEALIEEIQKETRHIKKYVEIISLEKHGIEVAVKIDYKAREITLVDHNQNTYAPKQWLFSKRGVQYMKSWKNILQAMQNAVQVAEGRLQYQIDLEQAKKADEVLFAGIIKR